MTEQICHPVNVSYKAPPTTTEHYATMGILCILGLIVIGVFVRSFWN